MRNKWDQSLVVEIFYRYGRIRPIPKNYEFVGVIEGFLPNIGVIGILVQNGTLRAGDRIAFELPLEFVEEEITSLELNKEAVGEVGAGCKAGVKTNLQKAQARDGVRVYRITH